MKLKAHGHDRACVSERSPVIVFICLQHVFIYFVLILTLKFNMKWKRHEPMRKCQSFFSWRYALCPCQLMRMMMTYHFNYRKILTLYCEINRRFYCTQFHNYVIYCVIGMQIICVSDLHQLFILKKVLFIFPIKTAHVFNSSKPVVDFNCYLIIFENRKFL